MDKIQWILLLLFIEARFRKVEIEAFTYVLSLPRLRYEILKNMKIYKW